MLVARLLASDFPSENPRTQTRNVPYTKTLPHIWEMTTEEIFNDLKKFDFSIRKHPEADKIKNSLDKLLTTVGKVDTK